MNRLDLTHSPLVLHHYDRSLEDLSGNGFDLIGNPIYMEVMPQVFCLGPGSDVMRPIHDPELLMTGTKTVEVHGIVLAPLGVQPFVSFTASGETLPTNTIWQFGTNSSSQLRWFQESGAGLDAVWNSAGASEGLPAVGSEFHAVAVYEAGVVRVYLNGRLHGTASGVLATPTGGTSAVLRVLLGGLTFGLLGLKVINAALTHAQVVDEYMLILGEDYGPPLVYGKLWAGALTHESITIVARMAGPALGLTLTLDDGVTTWETDPLDTDADNVARFEIDGLDPDTEYTYSLPCGVTGSFRTAPAAAGSPASFSVALSGDALTGSTHKSFNTILGMDPLMFLHMGDMHYQNITANTPSLFHAAFDMVFASHTQHRLLRSVPTAYIWDDHDGAGGNNTNGSAAGWPAACSVYRSRVPHYPLPHATAIYQTWDIGRVRFIMTDQRSQASSNSATDNASKTMLGATQKAWFKDIIANSPGMLLVWICPRWFGNANHTDSWNNFNTELTELCDHIKANALGRVLVLSADVHYIGVDDGTNVDHATGGGCPLPTFQASPLDYTPPSAVSGTWTHGNFSANGQFGMMEIEDVGDPTVQVTWKGYNSAGTLLTTHSFTASL